MAGRKGAFSRRDLLKASAGSFPPMLQHLFQDGVLVEEVKAVRLSSHHIELNAKQKASNNISTKNGCFYGELCDAQVFQDEDTYHCDEN